MNDSIFSSLNDQVPIVSPNFKINHNTNPMSFSLSQPQSNVFNDNNNNKTNNTNNHNNNVIINSNLENTNINNENESKTGNNITLPPSSQSIAPQSITDLTNQINKQLSNIINSNNFQTTNNLKLHEFFINPLKIIKSLLDKRMKCNIQLVHKNQVLEAADLPLAKKGAFAKYSYWNKFNYKQFQIPHPIQQHQLNEELFKINYDQNIKKIQVVIKHLNITINHIDNDIKSITDKTKSEFINFFISQLQSVDPVQQHNNSINLNFDINKLLPSIGNQLIRNKLISDFGPATIAQQFNLFFTSINNHHLLLLKRNQNLYLKDKINPIFIPHSASNKSNNFNQKNKYKNKNKNYNPFFRKNRKNNITHWGGNRGNYRGKNRGGFRNSYHSRNNRKNPRYPNRTNPNRNNSKNYPRFNPNTQNRNLPHPSLISTFAPSFNHHQSSESDDNDHQME